MINTIHYFEYISYITKIGILFSWKTLGTTPNTLPEKNAESKNLQDNIFCRTSVSTPSRKFDTLFNFCLILVLTFISFNSNISINRCLFTFCHMSWVESIHESFWSPPFSTEHDVVSRLVPEIVPHVRILIVLLPHPCHFQRFTVN